jgi:hypothetical protein
MLWETPLVCKFAAKVSGDRLEKLTRCVDVDRFKDTSGASGITLSSAALLPWTHQTHASGEQLGE